MNFDPVDPKQPLPDVERGILQYWREEGMFKRSLQLRKGPSEDKWDGPGGTAGATFSFYDGPPFATGMPHYGHLLAGTIKDVIPRYQTMQGKYVERRFGWDCHGLPIENLIEQEHNIGSKQEIEEMGVDKFNDLCRSAVQRYTTEWRTVVERMGRWVDMDWDYRTMDPTFMESMWWAFRELYHKKLIYEGHKSMHICTRCVTPLSNFEVTQGYVDRTDQSVVMTFPLKDDPKTVILAWTTTPWSLPGNVWLLVGPDIHYVKVKEGDTTYICAAKLVEKLFKDREHEVIGDIDAKDLVGLKYEPLFPYFVDTVLPSTEGSKPVTYGEKCFDILLDQHGEVSDADGTGIVHITTSHGEDGFRMAQELGVDILHHLNMDGSFKSACTDFVGLRAKPEGDDPMATDKAVIANLKERGRHFDSYTFNHSYPHCWRCDSPLLNYAASSWFVAVEQIKEKMLQNKDQTTWVPGHLRDGRYGKWIENARDWAISRNRYWGTPLPIWRSPQGDLEVIGGRDDLMAHHKIRYTKVSVLRHAESEGNTIPIYQGELPGTDLTKHGQKQAKAAAKQLKDANPDIIYCSPLARCLQTAEAVAKATGAEVIVDERLRETRFGDYEGKTIDFSDLDMVKAKRAHKYQTGSPESIYHFEGMETWEQTHARVKDFLDEILPKHRSQHVVVVTHADPLNQLKHYFTKEDPMKISQQPYPGFAQPQTFFWDHDRQAEMDLHKDRVDDVAWVGSPDEKAVQATIVRHGQAASNVADVENGWSDDPLTETGEQQALDRAKALEGETFDAVVCSDLPRAKQTAEIITKHLNLEITDVWEDLRERQTGVWQGKPVAEILTEMPHIKDTIKTTSFHYGNPDKAETFSEFIARADRNRRRLREEYAGKRVLVVTHGGMIRALRCLEENLTYVEAAELYPQNAEAIELTLSPLCERIPEVLDCWFESGSMPYSQTHFPFDCPGEKLPPGFPANFIAEGIDQTRCWFYVLMVLSTALFGKTPFQNVVVNGTVLAEDGKKMSKRLKNYPEPMEIVEKYGADAIRFTLMNSPAVRGEDLRVSERLVEENMRSVLLPLWNTYSFFVTYANAASFEPVDTRRQSAHPLDRWIQAEVQDLVNRMTHELDRYDLSATCSELFETIDAITNWYVRLSRRRFAGKGTADGSSASEALGGDHNADQLDALHTLYDVLLTLGQVLAPFCPFITDAIYLNLVNDEHHSIHLTDWPATRELTPEEQALLQKTRLQRQIVSLGLSIRGEQTIKIRQPLGSATVAVPPSLQPSNGFSDADLHLMQSELNVKHLEFVDDPGTLAEAYAQVNARAVGPRLGQRVQEIIQAGKTGDFRENNDGSITILDETLTGDEVQIVYRGAEGASIAADRGVVVSLDTTLTSELEQEGYARDLIRTVQRLRKESGLEFTDTVTLELTGADELVAAHGDLIAHETNATLGECGGQEEIVELGDMKVTVKFEKR